MSDYRLVCDCGYDADLLNVMNKKTKLQRHVVDECRETVCSECGQPCIKEFQVWRYVCPECGKDLVEIEPDDAVEVGVGESEYKRFNIGGDTYSKSIVSDSLAINPSQIAEHREYFPDVEVRSDGRPVFENFRQHDDYLKKTGFVKHRQKTKPKGTVIARMK